MYVVTLKLKTLGTIYKRVASALQKGLIIFLDEGGEGLKFDLQKFLCILIRE